MEIERRMVQANDLRVVAEGPPRIVGHAALFDILSDDLGGFRERIRPGAFAGSLAADDVRALSITTPTSSLGATAPALFASLRTSAASPSKSTRPIRRRPAI